MSDDQPTEVTEAMNRYLQTPPDHPDSERLRREYLEIAAKWRAQQSK